MVAGELGDPGILDQHCKLPGSLHETRALAPASILHIFSGNTPHAAMQSLVRGLLLGSRNFGKLPSAGLPEIERFHASLPAPLAALVTLSRELDPQWLEHCDAWVVFGADDTIAAFHELAARHGVHRFQPHGNKAGVAVVRDSRGGVPSARAVAEAVAVFNQQGCLSPHCVYLDGDGGIPMEDYAEVLAEELAALESSSPRGPLTLSENAAITEARDAARIRQALGENSRILAPNHSHAWTVVAEDNPAFRLSPLNRFIYLKPMPENIGKTLAPHARTISCCGIWNLPDVIVAQLVAARIPRICPIPQMQSPPWTWRQDGMTTLANLVSWCDREGVKRKL